MASVVAVCTWALVACAFSLASGAPSCKTIDEFKYRRITCDNFDSATDFSEKLPREPSDKPTWLLIQNSHVPFIPPGAFAGLNVAVLQFKFVTVDAFDQNTQETNPFSGLESSLLRVYFYYGSSLPGSWGMLSNMYEMEEVQLVHYVGLNLTKDFNLLHHNMKTVYIVACNISSVDSDWLASLNNLEALVIRETDLRNLSRSWLPRPAPRFTTLDLPGNLLTKFPEGLDESIPSLAFVNVERNRITTFEELPLGLLNRFGVQVNMMFNPVHCDCNLQFMLAYPSKWHYFLCHTPKKADVFDKYILDLTKEQLCETTD
ncbi:unnamed protein product [Ixodes pacificus]